MERASIACVRPTSTSRLDNVMPRRRDFPTPRILGSPRAFRALFLVAGLLACSGAESPSTAPASGDPAAIVITPTAPSIPLGSQLALQAQVHDATGQVVAGATVFWSTSDSTIAAVSSAGVVTGNNVGTAQVAASSGGQSAVVAVSVVQVPVASVAIVPSTATLTIGGTVALQGIAYDANGNTLGGRAFVWASSNPQIAKVDASGTVTAVAAGTATVTGTSEGKTASATITVTIIPVASVTVTPGSAALTVGQSASLSATAIDANGNVLSGRPVAWSSANTSVATVSSLGLVTATGAGSTTISASVEGKSGAAQVVVTAPLQPTPVASVTVSPATVSLAVGATATLSATVRDASGGTLSGRTVTWSTSASQVATVSSNGVVTAVAAGTATITATSEGKSGTAIITVQPPAPAPVATVSISPATLSISRNQTATLTAQVLDANGNVLTGRTITWSSSNGTTASVTASGQSTVLSVHNHTGVVTITATCEGVSGTAIITVTG